MRLRRIVGAAVVAALAAGSTQWVEAFYDDTHYSLTYYIARSCGYTQLQAYRIASANVAVDSPSSPTEPVQGDKVGTLRDIAQDSRVRFHAMWDARLTTTPRAMAKEAIKGRELQLLQLAREQVNPGVLLHYVQDEEPHAGYTSWGGHWFPSTLPDFNPLDQTHPFGATTDFLSYNPTSTYVMVVRTIDVLTNFMRTTSPGQRAGGPRCQESAILPVLASLVRVNPVSSRAAQYAAKTTEVLSGLASSLTGRSLNISPDQLEEELKKLSADEQATKAGPVVANADREIALALAGQLEIPAPGYQSFAQRRQYAYDVNGRNQTSEFPIYGTVTATVTGALGRAVGISVWAAPTRVGDKPYQLTKCQDSGYQFKNLPVGDLIVHSITDGKLTRTPVRLDRSEKTVELRVAPAKKEEATNRCRKEAAEMAAKACTNRSADATPDRSGPADDQLAQKVDECDQEEEKQRTEEQNTTNTQPTQATAPPSTGGGIGKILGWTAVVAGGAIGGAYLYEQSQLLAEEYGSTTTTSNPQPTNNPQPTSNTPSTVGLGGFSCGAANSTSGFRSCTGSINVRAGTLLGARAGQTVGVQTTPSFFVGTMTAPAVGGTTGTVSLRATLSSCPTQTFVNFAPTGGQPFESVSVSIPVSCP